MRGCPRRADDEDDDGQPLLPPRAPPRPDPIRHCRCQPHSQSRLTHSLFHRARPLVSIPSGPSRNGTGGVGSCKVALPRCGWVASGAQKATVEAHLQPPHPKSRVEICQPHATLESVLEREEQCPCLTSISVQGTTNIPYEVDSLLSLSSIVISFVRVGALEGKKRRGEEGTKFCATATVC